MAKILKFFSFQRLPKHILKAFLSLGGGGIQHLWVRPLWFSALQLVHITYTSLHYEHFRYWGMWLVPW